MLNSPRVSALTLLLLLWSASSLQMRAQAPVAATLASPLTAAAIFQLGSTSSTPESQSRLREAMNNPDPAIRASAARVIWAARLAALGPTVAEALSSETAHVAAIEEIRTVLSLGDTTADAAIFKAWQTLGPISAGDTALLYARARGLDALPALERLRQLNTSRPAAFPGRRTAA